MQSSSFFRWLVFMRTSWSTWSSISWRIRYNSFTSSILQVTRVFKLPDWFKSSGERAEPCARCRFTWLPCLWLPRWSTAKRVATGKPHSSGMSSSARSKWTGLSWETSAAASLSVGIFPGGTFRPGTLSTSHRYVHFSCSMETNCWCPLMKRWSLMASHSSMCQERTLKAVPRVNRWKISFFSPAL